MTKTKRDFLTQDEVNALLKGVTGEEEDVSEDAWAAAMAEQAKLECRHPNQNIEKTYSVTMPENAWRKLVDLLKPQPIGEFYHIYTAIVSKLPANN